MLSPIWWERIEGTRPYCRPAGRLVLHRFERRDAWAIAAASAIPVRWTSACKARRAATPWCTITPAIASLDHPDGDRCRSSGRRWRSADARQFRSTRSDQRDSQRRRCDQSAMLRTAFRTELNFARQCYRGSEANRPAAKHLGDGARHRQRIAGQASTSLTAAPSTRWRPAWVGGTCWYIDVNAASSASISMRSDRAASLSAWPQRQTW